MALTSLSLLIATLALVRATQAAREALFRVHWLRSAFYDTKEMTMEVCLNYCTAGGYPYAGLEYSQECCCGLVNRSPREANATDCNQLCSRSNQEICGGPERLSLCARPIPEPSANPGINGYQSLGCWTDNIINHVLSHFTIMPGGPKISAIVESLIATIVAPGTTRRLMGLRPPVAEMSSSTPILTATRSDVVPKPALSAVPVLTLVPSIVSMVNSALLNSTSSATISTSPPPMLTPTPITRVPLLPTILLSTSTALPLPLVPALTNLLTNSIFTHPSWQSVINPLYGDYFNLLGSVVTSGPVSACIMATKPVRPPAPRSLCLQQPISIASAGTYKLTLAIGRQILHGTCKPIPSTDHLQYNVYYDSTLLGGLRGGWRVWEV
ncbi:uncharacterized protein CC84DRAFT_1248224 [Paraphaeosphaeria sporulosa]|uniref:WSC domain-containing protein n=1 Tax=Paraphaeosphaeria sporulosa TaxID=1460663 RepID=A0A177CES6_9PLEO|nr:uncharacterized protein CC84DRAFT_1248224 [Paraphaeosphaeria sporulosa]OAG05309.1 hypothetical protein CC84DRAFT_1248224 [Paraphaeosphaeria sporulosa]